MRSKAQQKHILVIDRQDYWRELSVRALTEAGFSVRSLDNYDYPPSNGHLEAYEPDLVVLGCASIGPDEQKVMANILEHKHHLLVLSTSLPWSVMRALFLAGADDVGDKPYERGRLIEIVTQALERSMPRDSYEAAKREGVR